MATTAASVVIYHHHFFFSFLLLTHAALGLAAGPPPSVPPENCPPFSCGRLRDVSFPFRRESDPQGCGDTLYQLNCEGDEAVIRIGSADYYVVQVADENRTFHVVDPSLANSSCPLPARSALYFDSETTGIDCRTSSFWASFVNCTEEIHVKYYRSVPCLSRNHSFVYVIAGENSFVLQYLEPSCHFLTSVPLLENSLPDSRDHPCFLDNTSNVDVFSILRHGFECEILWHGHQLSRAHWCLRATKRAYHKRLRRNNIFNMISVFQKGQTYFFDCIQVSHSRRKLIQVVEFLTGILILCRIVMPTLVLLFFLAYNLWGMLQKVDNVEKFLRNQQSLLTPKRFAYADIIAITRHFRDKLGQGGFGSVFKGELPGGVFVAVKLLGNSKCNGDEFINEVSTIGRIHHVNVVRLVGFCSDGSKRALVYEYMPNGSLDKYIFSRSGVDQNHIFTSEKLIDIAINIARGIDYLHQGCDMQILHFDIKPHNILLDHNFTPKISDFGLAKLYPKHNNNNIVSISAARGTIGYIAPEVISRSFGTISYKSDVYSFGMLLMEMAGRRRNVNPLVENSSQVYYPSWIFDKLMSLDKNNVLQLSSSFEIEDSEKKLSIVGLWCIQMRPSNRPTMARILEMLEADVETLPLPPKPFFSSTSTNENFERDQTGLDSSKASELLVISE